jgi:putative transposon-encoded protein
MSEKAGSRVRVVLRWVQIKDNKEGAWDDEGEFRFTSNVTTAGSSHKVEIPAKGYWSISDHPRRNKVDKIDKVLFEGAVGDNLVVELSGVELDDFSTNDELQPYRREYTGATASWVGRHQPTDEGSEDPENMSDWRICYDIEVV